MRVPPTMTGKKLKRKILKKINTVTCSGSCILVHNRKRVDTNQPIGLQVLHEGSIMLQITGKGGGREHMKQTLELLGKFLC